MRIVILLGWMLAAVLLSTIVAAEEPTALDETNKRIAALVQTAAVAAGGQPSLLDHECYYRDMGCDDLVADDITIFGCRTDDGDYYNIHRLRVPDRQRLQITMRSSRFVPLLIVTDSNFEVLASNTAETGSKAEVSHTTTYAGTYYVIAATRRSFETGLYSIHVACELAPRCNAPRITRQPLNSVIHAGDMLTLDVAATGTEPLRYQWENRRDVLGGILFGPKIEIGPMWYDAEYVVTIANSCGSVASHPAMITVVPPRRRSVRR